eukprot:13054714-Alexandrium_andersonii.AAC.1
MEGADSTTDWNGAGCPVLSPAGAGGLAGGAPAALPDCTLYDEALRLALVGSASARPGSPANAGAVLAA